MGFDTLITQQIVAAKKITASLQQTITLETFAQDNATTGKREYASSGTEYKVIIDYRQRRLGLRDGEQQVSQCSIQFLEPVAVGQLDRITMPDGSQPQILSIEGAVDTAGAMFAPRVYF